MKFTFTKSFERSLEKSSEKDRVKKAVEMFMSALDKNIKPEGLGLKKLKDDVWEIRAGLRNRILFILYPGEIRFLLVGDHNRIKDYLKDN